MVYGVYRICHKMLDCPVPKVDHIHVRELTLQPLDQLEQMEVGGVIFLGGKFGFKNRGIYYGQGMF